MSGSVLKKYLTVENLQRWAGAAAVAVGVGLAAPAVAADSPSGLRSTPDPDQDCTAIVVKQKAATPAAHKVHRKVVAKPAVANDAEGHEDKPKPHRVVRKPHIHHPAKPTAASSDKTMWECYPKAAVGTPQQSYSKDGPTPRFADLVPGFRPGAPLPQLPLPLPPSSVAPPLSPPPPPPPPRDECVNLDALVKDKQGQYRPDKVAQAKRDFPELSEKCGLPDVPGVPNVPPIERPKPPTDRPPILPPRDDIPNPVPEPGTLALVGAAAAALLARNPRKAVTAIKKALD